MNEGTTRSFGGASWALLDQGLFAGANFMLIVLVARWMSPQQYGIFATGLAVHALVGLLHVAFFLDPLLVFGAGKYQDRFPRYLGALLCSHAAFALLSGTFLLVAWVGVRYLGQQPLAGVLPVIAATAPFILLHLVMRQACFASNVPRIAALSGIVYMALMLIGIAGLHRLDSLSPSSAFWSMGGASLAVALILMVPIRPGPSEKSEIKEVMVDHWRFGRWLVGASVMQWIPSNLYYFILPAWIGLDANATYRALSNLIFPFGRIVEALNRLLVPALVRARGVGPARFARLVRLWLVAFICMGVVYWLALSIMSERLIGWLYQGKYVSDARLLVILGLSVVTGGIVAVLGSAAQALQHPNWWFWGSLASSAVMLTAGLGLVVVHGLTGAAIGFVLTTVAAVGTLAWFYYGRSSSERNTM